MLAVVALSIGVGLVLPVVDLLVLAIFERALVAARELYQEDH